MPAENIKTPSESPSVSAQQYSAGPTAEVTQPTSGMQSNDLSSSYLTPSTSASVATSSQDSTELSQTDFEGHYVGPASGVSFLLKIQKRLHRAISFSYSSSIFTFGDAPLHPPDLDPSFCMMLSRGDAQRLVDRYFDFAMPTYRFLHRPTIQEWFEEFYDTLGIMRDAHSAPAKVALLFMVLAQARVYMPDNDRPGPSDLKSVSPLRPASDLANIKNVQYTILPGSRASSHQRDGLNTVDKRSGTLDSMLLPSHTISH
jgi:hypothetical protein